MNSVTVSLRDVSAHHHLRQVFHGLSFDLRAGQVLGVTGPPGAGTNLLLRVIVGAIAPSRGDILINGVRPPAALARTAVAYFAGEATLPPFVRAHDWCALWTADAVTGDRRELRWLPRGVRQLVGLRAQLARHPVALVLLDNPWEGLDPDGVRWLDATLESKRDRGAAVVVSSRDVAHLAGLCDKYLFLTPYAPVIVAAHDMTPTGRPSREALQAVFDRLQSEPSRALTRWAIAPRAASWVSDPAAGAAYTGSVEVAVDAARRADRDG